MSGEPLELVVRGQDEAVAFACGSCGAVFSARIEGARELAVAHCRTVCPCGRPLAEGQALCFACAATERGAREARLFADATKVSIDDYPDEPVYWEGQAGTMGEGFFLNIDEVLDYCEEEELETPKYVWACTPRPLRVPTESVLEAAVEEHNTIGVDDISVDAVGELQTFLDGWCAKQNVRTWFPDFERAVLLREPAESPE
jgi:hypothetical protein